MATKIEILGLTPERVALALYYVIPSPIAAAADAARTPAGIRLSPAEHQALKDGALFEVLRTVIIADLPKSVARAAIESMWSDHQVEAFRTYNRLYTAADLVGMAWDGGNWS